jgi:hypothetical protein
MDFIRLEAVIRARVQHSFNKKELEKFNLLPEDFVINKRKVAQTYSSLDDKTRGSLTRLVGGAANFKLTKKYLETL